MTQTSVFLALLLGLAASAPTSDETEKLVITKNYFPDQLVVYTAQHDIVKIFVPLNALNFDDDSEDDDTDDDSGTTLFFVEADINNETGEKTYQGLYVLKNGNATKLLDNGKDATATNDETKLVYFGAKDGLYVYNAEQNSAEKYGSVTDSIISLEKANDTIYILTEDKQLFKVTENGTVQVKVDDVQNAEEIVLDSSYNLYYYGSDKKPFVFNAEGVKKIEGLPENPSQLTLLAPPFVIDDGVPCVVDNKAYIIYANGTSELSDFEFEVKPTAYSMEATLIQYYGYDKKIYEYNVLALVLGDVLDELKNFFNDRKDSIQSIATRSRSDLRASA